jgi:hypothetical protein
MAVASAAGKSYYPAVGFLALWVQWPEQADCCIVFRRDRREAVSLFRARRFANVCLWHIADIGLCAAHVRFRGKADIACAKQRD